MHRVLRSTTRDNEEERVQNQELTHSHTNMISMRTIRTFLRKKRLIMMVILIIAMFNIFNAILHGMPADSTSTVSSISRKVSSSASRKESLTTPRKVSSSTRAHTLSTAPPANGTAMFYRLVKDTKYHYEFRFELNTNSTDNNHRLMILLNGSGRQCIDYWNFPVGRRILSTIRAFRFQILVICSARKKFDVEEFVQNNSDVRWIYTSLQKWMNDVYYKTFQRYPLLYIHGISRGSRLAALLGRILPIQSQIYTIYPGHWEGMLTRSDHHIDMRTRLLDPVFANWFYFDFCYNTEIKVRKISNICPLQSERNYFQPVSPTYFIHMKKDPYFKESDFETLMKFIRGDAFELGGAVLNHTQSVQLYVIPPVNVTPSYMQEHFDMWNSKPYASKFFYQHFIAPETYKPYNKTLRSCLCKEINFRHFLQYPNIMMTWPKKIQEEYKDYANDIQTNGKAFCEEMCGDLVAHHAMSSRDLDKGLEWMNAMDSVRNSFHIKDYLTRPLRIWMYEKDSIMKKTNLFPSHELNWMNLSPSYQMYSPEYYLQNYFQYLKTSSTYFGHNLKWTNNPLLADYFIIPSDLMFHYFHSEPANMTDIQFKNLRSRLNHVYFEPLLRNVQTIFPYWTMVNQADQMGSNHIIAILDGANMGLLYDRTQYLLKNVIQLVFRGARQDMLSANATLSHDYRNMTIAYRHGYDVILPQFTRLKLNEDTPQDWNIIFNKKKQLFFFAGSLVGSMKFQSARQLLSYIWKNRRENKLYNMTTEIQGRQFDTIIMTDRHIEPHKYIELIQSSMFVLCPEDFLSWSSSPYEAIQIGAIPIILADNIVLPFERFIDWQSFTGKINISNIKNIVSYVYRIDNFEEHIKQKFQNALRYSDAFQWPYSVVNENEQSKLVFLPHEDRNGSANNVFHYLSLELKCRRLEQLFGLTSDSFSMKSIIAQRRVCRNYPHICPCRNLQQTIAFREYL